MPDEPVDEWHHDVNRLPMYGMRRWCDAFTARQKVALGKFGTEIQRRSPDLRNEVRVAVSIGVDRTADYNSANCRWVSHGEFVGNTFTRQALPIVWDFTEVNPVAGSTGSFASAIDWIANVIEAWPNSDTGQIQSADATDHPLPDQTAAVWFTDPPYYDAIDYAHCSDFFFVWLKRTLPW